MKDDTADPAVLRHCREIDRCNQRGGRMLSIMDLIEAETIDPLLAAYALAAIGSGASFQVGANPGGAGKTTVMGALLNFVPPGVELAPADGADTIRRGMNAEQQRCYLCHEISSGFYYAYLWGADLRAYFRLPEAGHMLATNLHADTYEEAREQICDDNGVPAEHLRRMHVMFFLSVGGFFGRHHRKITEVWESDGKTDHRPIWQQGRSVQAAVEDSLWVDVPAWEEAQKRIEWLRESGTRSIQEVREALVNGWRVE